MAGPFVKGFTAAALVVFALSGGIAQSAARDGKPKAPLGRDPGGIAIAVVGTGIDYTRPDVAARLARDGEGEPIGWDAIDEDARPFAPGVGLPVLIEPSVRLVAVRAEVTRAETIRRALMFVARTPARIVVITEAPPPAAADLIETLAPTLPHILVIVAAGDAVRRFTAGNIVAATAWAPGAEPPAARTNADIVVAPAAALREAPGAPDAPPTSAGEAAMGLAGLLVCTPGLLQNARSPQDARQRLIASGRRLQGVTVPVIEACASREDPPTRRTP